MTNAATNIGLPADGLGTIVNDQHSRLNATAVKRIIRPGSLVQLSETIKAACARKLHLSIAGGRHAMGGQQFLQNGILLDMTALDRVLEFNDAARMVRCEAGATWPRLLSQLEQIQAGASTFWTFAQKQSGADNLTLGGAISANVHGRGLSFGPFVEHVVSIDIVTSDGKLVRCSRQENPHLFSLVIGGYGLFGVVYAVTLQLVERQVLRRKVQIVHASELMDHFSAAVNNGALYGDFQFAIDPASDDFLNRGVFAVYEPAPGEQVTEQARSLTGEDWERLLLLAHTDKSKAFSEYSSFYKSTHGQLYWSDRQQLSHYVDGYHQRIDLCTGAACPGSEMISELYVPRKALPAFLHSVRIFARRYGWNIIYGTIRLIEKETETFLSWAREPWACVIFNICVEHSDCGLEEAKSAFRCLTQIAINYGGSYYLTYHKWMTRDQMIACYPQFPEFLAQKLRFDPEEIFVSNWYYSHRNLFS